MSKIESSIMRRTKQHGWALLNSEHKILNLPDKEKPGWYKLGIFKLNKSVRVLDQATCHAQGCLCNKSGIPIRGKGGKNKARGKNKRKRMEREYAGL